MSLLPESVMEVNGVRDDINVSAFVSESYGVLIGVQVAREYEEDGGGVYRQITVSSEDKADGDEDFEMLLSVDEATNIRDALTRAIALAVDAPEPPGVAS